MRARACVSLHVHPCACLCTCVSVLWQAGGKALSFPNGCFPLGIAHQAQAAGRGCFQVAGERAPIRLCFTEPSAVSHNVIFVVFYMRVFYFTRCVSITSDFAVIGIYFPCYSK